MTDDPTVEVINFGCRLNLLESEAMRRAALAGGHRNLVIVNSCAVTAEAVRQAGQAIRRSARSRPGAEIVVTGCAAETERSRFEAMPEVARILPNSAKTRPESWSAGIVADEQPEFASLSPLAARPQGHTRAFVQVQTGCDHRCTFCIIPIGRGASRSVSRAAVIAAVMAEVEAGVPEVVLTGVDLTSWGQDLGTGQHLGDLVQAILGSVPELRRLRLSSIDSVEADPALIDAIATDHRLMPHLHLSLQAGDDLILKRMKRRHGRADAIEFCRKIRDIRPDIVLGADFIAGFPTETEDMFARTVDLVEECGITHLHVFPYSPRVGTPAARMPQVPGTIARERAQRLRNVGKTALANHLDRQVGQQVEVLSENGGIGRARDFTPVELPPGTPAGEFLTLAIAGHDGRRLQIANAAALLPTQPRVKRHS